MMLDAVERPLELPPTTRTTNDAQHTEKKPITRLTGTEENSLDDALDIHTDPKKALARRRPQPDISNTLTLIGTLVDTRTTQDTLHKKNDCTDI